MPLPGEGTDNERYDPCEAISRVGVEKMAAGGLVLEAGGGVGAQGNRQSVGKRDCGKTLGRVLLGMWQDLVHNSLTPMIE